MAAGELTDFQQSLLGILSYRPMAGYDLKKAFAGSPLGRYSPSSGGIYPALARLEQLGLVSAHVEQAHELRPRRVYTPTPAGLRALDAWLGQKIDRAMVERDMSSVILRFALLEGRLAQPQVVAFLEQLRETLAGYLADLEAYGTTAGAGASRHQALALRFGSANVRTQLGWAETALAEIRGAGG